MFPMARTWFDGAKFVLGEVLFHSLAFQKMSGLFTGVIVLILNVENLA